MWLIRKIIKAILFRIYLLRMFFRRVFFDKILGKAYYKKIGNSQLMLNWVVQRVFRMNSDIPISVSYTSKIQGFNNIILKGDSERAKISIAVSGGCYFTIFEGTTLEIGEGTLWAYNICIQTGNHDLHERGKHNLASVKIGSNCWLGNGVTILPGVELGDNVTVGANAVVTKSFPSNVVVAGCPAKIIKQL